MTKDLHKAIVKRSLLYNLFLCSKSETSRKEYKKYFCSNFFRKAKKDHFSISSITDNNIFWQTVNTLFSDKVKSHRNLNLAEKDKLTDDEEKIAEIFN